MNPGRRQDKDTLPRTSEGRDSMPPKTDQATWDRLKKDINRTEDFNQVMRKSR